MKTYLHHVTNKTWEMYGWKIFSIHENIGHDTTITVPEQNDFFGLYVNLGDEQRYTVDSLKRGTLCKNQFNFIYIPACRAELRLLKGEYSVFCVAFSRTGMENMAIRFPVLKKLVESAKRNEPAVLTGRCVISTVEMMRIISHVLYSMQHFDHSKIEDLLKEGLVRIESKSNFRISDFDKTKLESAYNYIETNCDKNFSVDFIADMADMSRSTFERRFKFLYGKTVHHVHLELRLKKAMILLTNTSLNVEDIALKVGYQKPSWFREAFKKKYGHPPSYFLSQNSKGHSKRIL